MKNSTLALMNYPEKNRMVLRLYWICSLCVICLQIFYYVSFYLTDSLANRSVPPVDYIRTFIVTPSVIYLLLGAVLFLLRRRYGESAPVAVAAFMMTGMVMFVNVVSYTHYGIAVIYAAFIFPIILSLFYNNRTLTLSVSFFVLISYVILVAVYLPTRNQLFVRHDATDMAAMPVILILVTLAGMRILGIYSDLIDKIIDQTIKKIALEREAKEDSLTRLYNHAVFYEFLDSAINQCNNGSKPLCIIVMDIDNFKAVNDTYGHAFGDTVLLHFADIVRARIGEQDKGFRYGGEEFAVISFRSPEDSVLLAENIRTAFSEAKLSDHPEARFTISIGVSTYSAAYTSKRDFFASADRALYTAKNQGKNRTVAV